MNFEKQSPLLLDEVSQQILMQTPLHYACYIGDGHLLDTLIGRALLYNNNNGDASSACVGALISEEDSLNGWTPAHWAAFYGQLSCLMKLHVKQHSGCVDIPTHRSNTSPLHLAAQSGAVLCLKYLLQCGAARNKQDFMGETPLHKAAKAGNTDCVALLVSHGASLDMKNHRGLVPSDVAEQSNHPALAQLLRRALEQAEFNSSNSWPLPISELNGSLTHSPPNIFHSSSLFNSHTVKDMSDSNIFMNGELISNRDAPDSSAMEEGEQEMTEHCSQVVESDGPLLGKCFGGMKRSFDDEEDVITHIQKRRCFVPASQKSHAERYGDACNNNIISSYSGVLAMRVEPLKICSDSPPTTIKPGSPVTQQSSMMEHQASVLAQQGYDSTLMNTMSSVFH